MSRGESLSCNRCKATRVEDCDFQWPGRFHSGREDFHQTLAPAERTVPTLLYGYASVYADNGNLRHYLPTYGFEIAFAESNHAALAGKLSPES